MAARTSERVLVTWKERRLPVVAPRTACMGFLGGRLSEEELIRQSEVYLTDRDMVVGMKRVEIELR